MRFPAETGMQYALANGTQHRDECQAGEKKERLDPTARITLSRAVFSEDLCSFAAGAVGISVLLLVSVWVGYWSFTSVGSCVPETKNIGQFESDSVYQLAIKLAGHKKNNASMPIDAL
jgi:hypothetical protein